MGYVLLPLYRKIEEKRGVTLTDSGLPEPKPSPAVEGVLSGQTNKAVSSAPTNTRRSSAWDEDWIPTRGGATGPQTSTATSTTQPPQSKSVASSSPATQQPLSSCPAVDVEWPPKNSSSAGPAQFNGLDSLNGNKSTPESSLDDIDPFANWPPRSTNVSGSMNNGTPAPSVNKYGFNSSSTSTNGLNSQSSSWAFGMQTQSQGISSTASTGSSNGGLSSQYSLGQLKQNNGVAAPGIGSSNQKATNLDSIFASNKNKNTALRLAPPPATAVGRGRGRGRGSQGQTKSRNDQPPLLDLL